MTWRDMTYRERYQERLAFADAFEHRITRQTSAWFFDRMTTDTQTETTEAPGHDQQAEQTDEGEHEELSRLDKYEQAVIDAYENDEVTHTGGVTREAVAERMGVRPTTARGNMQRLSEADRIAERWYVPAGGKPKKCYVPAEYSDDDADEGVPTLR